MTQQRKLILLSNDDGYRAPGINRLMEWLAPLGDIVVVAPDGPRSGASCSITSAVPVTVKEISRSDGLKVYACSGTPVDCIKMALAGLMPRRPDIVVSGINHGDNASINFHYSGTMGAATEGALQRLKSVAFSSSDHDPHADLSPLKPYVMAITEQALAHDMPELTCINVNFPMGGDFRGVKLCRMCHSQWLRDFDKVNVKGRGDFYFLTGNWTNMEPECTDTDSYALEHGYVAVTPTTLDVTSASLMSEMEHWKLQ